MQILDGKKISNKFAEELSQQIFALKEKLNDLNASFAPPKLVIIQIGKNDASDLYISTKVKFAERIGAIAEVLKFPETITATEVIFEIEKINNDKNVNGIIVQLPIPNSIDREIVLQKINPDKDVDGLSPVNISKLAVGDKTAIIPATARAVIELLQNYNIEIFGKKVVVVGRSDLVGKPTAVLFRNLGADVTVCHSGTVDLVKETKVADILVSATGKIGLIGPENVHENQIVIDVGITKNELGKIVGDVYLGQAQVSAITPVPGGIGPMTVACLFKNLVEAWKRQNYDVNV